MASLGDRLVALSGEVEVEQKPKYGVWLAEQLDEYKLSKGITEDTVPSPSLIMLQVLPPKFKTTEELEAFKEPIRQWEPVTGEKGLGQGWSWDKTNLPEEEILERPPPSPLDRKEFFSTGKWLQAAPIIVKEEIFNNNGEIKIPKKEEVLNNNDLDDSVEVTVFDSSCVISVTKRALRQGGDCYEGGGGRDRGGRGDYGRSGDRGDRGGRQERAPRPGDYRGSRDRSRSPRYRQGEDRGDRSHGGASQDRSYSRRDTRTNQGYHGSRDSRDASRDGSYGGRRQGEGYSHQRSSRGESSRDRSYGSNGGRYQGDSRTSPQERGDRGPGPIKQEENVYPGGARADGNLNRQERPSGQVQVKQEAGLATTAGTGNQPRSYKEYKEMQMREKMMKQKKKE